MPRISESIPINNELLDRRVKLTKAQKNEIVQKYKFGRLMAIAGGLHPSVSTRSLAKEYRVSKRTIQFILDPEKMKANYQRRVERGGSKYYYDNGIRGEKWRLIMKNHRDYKEKLYKAGLIGANFAS